MTTKNPTRKQRLAFKEILENHGNFYRAMKKAGYKEVTAKMPTNLTESQGYKTLLKESGLTEELIAKSLVEDIEKKKGNRIGELRLGSDILRMTKPEEDKDIEVKVNIVSFSSKVENPSPQKS